MPNENKQRPITAIDLVGISEPVDLALSPDGEKVAFVLTETDLQRSEVRAQVHVAPGEDLAPSGGVDRHRQLTYGLQDAGHPTWSPDGKHLAFLTFRPQPHEEEDDDRREDGREKHQVFLLPASGGEARRLTESPEGVDLYLWWPDGSGVATLGPVPRAAAERGWRRRRHEQHDDAHVVYADIPALEICLHPLDGRPERLLAGVRGIEDFDVSPDGRWLAYSTNHTGRPQDSERVEVILRELETGRERRVTNGRGGAESRPRFTADGRFLLFQGWSDPKVSFSRQELLAVDLRQPGAPLRALLSGIDRDLEEFATLADGRVAALLAWGFESRLAIIDPATGQWEIVPIEGRVMTQLAAARAVSRLALVVEDGASLPEVARIDLPAEASLPHGASPTGRDVRLIETLTDLHEESREWLRARRRRSGWRHEGHDHEGLLLSPPMRGERAPPCLVWIHGGPHWRVLDTLRVYEAEAIAAEGWAVFMPHFRGSSGYEQRYSLASRGDLGGADARDILAGIEQLVDSRLVDPERLAVAGASYGGYMTNWLLATTERFRAGVSIAGIFDLAQDYTTSDLSSWEEHYLGAKPWENLDLYRERSPVTHAASITAPVLILHGLDDDNTIFTNSKGLHRALTALGREVELVYYPREGHGLFEPAHRVDALHRIIDWIGRHVEGRSTVHVTGRDVRVDGLRLVPLGHQARRDYAGVRPAERRQFLEVSVVLQAREDGPEHLRLVPCGSGSDLVLADEAGDIYRPIGVPIDVHGHSVLLTGRGSLEAWRAEDSRPAALPLTVVFEVPARPGQYRLIVWDLPAVILDVAQAEDDDAHSPEDAPVESPIESKKEESSVESNPDRS
ncbi:MAG: S9 family peptidase [Acidobacteriota bacterium]|nr:MAG: S9 family peptidase [Acidobacteriota bacterium]